MNDVIILAAIVALEIDLHHGALACLEQNSLMQWILLGGLQIDRYRFRAHLAASTERVLFQTSEGAVV